MARGVSGTSAVTEGFAFTGKGHKLNPRQHNAPIQRAGDMAIRAAQRRALGGVHKLGGDTSLHHIYTPQQMVNPLQLYAFLIPRKLWQSPQ